MLEGVMKLKQQFIKALNLETNRYTVIHDLVNQIELLEDFVQRIVDNWGCDEDFSCEGRNATCIHCTAKRLLEQVQNDDFLQKNIQQER
jgi:hypothetical protein